MSQPFKLNDEKERRVVEATKQPIELISNNRTDFYNGAYTAHPLGDVLYDLKRSPLSDAVTRETFRQGFYAIHDLFTRPGTFEFYLDVFRAVWGDDVAVEFSIPDPGKLLINIEALSIQLNDFLSRRIVNNAYVFDEVVDHNGDNIVFQGTQGIRTQNETDALIFELYPAGVWVQATLVIS